MGSQEWRCVFGISRDAVWWSRGEVAECRGWWAFQCFACFCFVHRIYQTMYGKNNNLVSKLDILWNQMRGARGLPFPMIILLFDGRNQSTSPMHVDLKFIGTPIILAFIWLNSPILQLLPPLLEVSKEVYRIKAMLFQNCCFKKVLICLNKCTNFFYVKHCTQIFNMAQAQKMWSIEE